MTKSKVKAIATPQTREAVVDAIAEIGRLMRQRTRIEADLNDTIATLKQSAETRAQPLGERIGALTDGVHAWCEAHRAELTGGGRVKTVALASGEVAWRITPPKVVLKGVKAVLDALRRAGLTRLIRTKEEIDKEAILADPKAVSGIGGIRIEQDEEFTITPFETTLEPTP